MYLHFYVESQELLYGSLWAIKFWAAKLNNLKCSTFYARLMPNNLTSVSTIINHKCYSQLNTVLLEYE